MGIVRMKLLWKRPVLGLMAIALMTSAAPVMAQKASTTAADAEMRLRKLEAEIRAIQRQVFPGGDGKYFPPEIQKNGSTGAATTATGTPATTPVTDLLTRMEGVETQLSRLTSQNEESANRIAQLEAKVAALTPAPAPVPVAATLTPVPVPTPVIATPTAVAPKPVVSAPPTPGPSKPVAPSVARLTAVKAIEKPKSDDAGEDEYAYGYRLWEAKFLPEAEQQLQLTIDKYPRHQRLSFARNLLGRAFLDDGKPREAAQWFLKNYQVDRKGARAPDSLLFLAESMRQIKDTNRACIALGEFADGYKAEAAGRLKSQYEATRGGLKCN